MRVWPGADFACSAGLACNTGAAHRAAADGGPGTRCAPPADSLGWSVAGAAGCTCCCGLEGGAAQSGFGCMPGWRLCGNPCRQFCCAGGWRFCCGCGCGCGRAPCLIVGCTAFGADGTARAGSAAAPRFAVPMTSPCPMSVAVRAEQAVDLLQVGF